MNASLCNSVVYQYLRRNLSLNTNKLRSNSKLALVSGRNPQSANLSRYSFTANNKMSAEPYVPPEVWTMAELGPGGGGPANLNKPEAGARTEKDLPVGEHLLQVYALATPNGQKVNIMLEELLDAGVAGAEYDAHFIDIGKGDQFCSGFVAVNPNSKIPCLLDRSMNPPLRVFESGHILLYLAEKFGKFLPTEPAKRTETLNWLFWAHGATPLLGAGFGHFFKYAPEKMKYPLNRFTMEVKRQMDVLDKQLADKTFVTGDEFTIADIAAWTYYGGLALGMLYPKSAEFVDAQSYKNLMRWAKEVGCRKGVIRGRTVNRPFGAENEKCLERHCAKDIDDVLAKKP